MSYKKVLVLGASGMLGNAIFRFLASSDGFAVYGTVRSGYAKRLLPPHLRDQIVEGVDVENLDSLLSLFARINPDIVINCIGVVKQLDEAVDPLVAIPINTILPHRLARLCTAVGARLIHMSTDCVFSGAKGMYTESDFSDADDLYGRSKYLGEVCYSDAITLRTSIVGHELDGARSLLCWFLSKEGYVNGYRRAVFSGLPTVEIARIIRDYVIPAPQLHGVYHLSSDPISKFDLLGLVSKIYGKEIKIEPDDSFVIDRSLDSTRFQKETGFSPRGWTAMIVAMRNFG